MAALIPILAVLFVTPLMQAWQASAPPAAQRESVEDLVNHLTPEQKQLFDQAGSAFRAQRYADALPPFKQLLTQLPGDSVLSKFAGEAALNAGDTTYAMTILKPLTAVDSNDWQAAALLTRACAQSGDASCRDSGMAHLLDLHRQGTMPQRMQDYVLERIAVGDNVLVIRPSLEPWGPYNVYAMGQVLNRNGQIFLRTTIESNDGDQALFAKEHAKEASQGLRGFSLDGYLETGLNSQGQRTQTHFTYKFFIGQPPYTMVREEFINVASGKSKPLSSRTNLVVP